MSLVDPSPLLANLPTNSPYLRDLLSNPIEFGEVYHKSSFAPHGVREVRPGPPSPLPTNRELDLGIGSSRSANSSRPASPVQPLIGPVQPTPSPSVQSTPRKAVPVQSDASPSKRKIQSLSLPITHLDWPESLRNRKAPAAGLYNPSMTCYANATLQVIMHTPPFLGIAKAHRADTCILRESKKFCLLCVLRDMIVDSHWSKKGYSPEVHKCLNHIKKGFNRNRQEDTHEFFRFVTDALQNSALAGLSKDLPHAVKHTTWVHRLWGGRVRSRVVCGKCRKPSDTFDDFLDLSLDCHSSRRSLAAMLQSFIREDRLEGENKYHCEGCKAKANATKSFRIAEAPPILTLHLKRFSVNYNSYNGRARADKFNQAIEYPEYLDISPYMVEPTTGTQYRLFGVTCHRGVELRFGHYTSYVRGPSGNWFHADDEDVHPANLREVMHDKAAYLLSYIRIPDGSIPRANTGMKTPIPNGIPRTNGFTATPRTDGSVTTNRAFSPQSSPVKRKNPSYADEEEEDEEPEGIEWKKESNSTARTVPSPVPSPPRLFASALDPDTPPAENSRWGYQPKLKPKLTTSRPPIPEANFYNKTPNASRSFESDEEEEQEEMRRPVHMSKKQKKRERKRQRREAESSGAVVGARHGAPMPFMQGQKRKIGGKDSFGFQGLGAGRMRKMQMKK